MKTKVCILNNNKKHKISNRDLQRQVIYNVSELIYSNWHISASVCRPSAQRRINNDVMNERLVRAGI